MRMSRKTIDDFFKPTSLEVAKSIIGMNIECKNGVYVVSATKAYFGESKQTNKKDRLRYGTIMTFNVRGHPHFCVSTGKSIEPDYFLINKLLKNGDEIKSSKRVSEALGLDMEDEGNKFSDYFKLSGQPQPSTFKQGDTPTCLRAYELKKT